MKFYDANVPGPNPVTVRQFVLERGGICMDVEQVDLGGLANRGPEYINNVNSRGEVPALRLDDGTVITETTAICAYLDEKAQGSSDIIGKTPEERAIANMWTRRVYLEFCSPSVTWARALDGLNAFYQGHRTPAKGSEEWLRGQAERGLERFDKDLRGKAFFAGSRLTLADILLNSFLVTMDQLIPWQTRPDLKELTRWRAAMADRPSTQAMMQPLPEKVG